MMVATLLPGPHYQAGRHERGGNLALAACGDDDSGDSATAQGDDPKKAIPGFSDVQECLEGLGYQLDPGEKNNIPVRGGDGSKAANLDVHPSEQAAQK